MALIAWDDLTPKTRATITEILKQHHRYQEDLMLDAPEDETPEQQAQDGVRYRRHLAGYRAKSG